MKELKLTHPRTVGPAVVRLQEHLDALGFECGEHDGVYGTATEAALRKAQIKLGVKEDGICGTATWEAILAASSTDADTPAATGPKEEGTIIVDRRGEHPRPKLYGHPRGWDQIEGVTLHQTGCRMSNKPKGWDRLNAHIGITGAGQAIIANDPTDMIWHAQGLSKSTIGIEIGGNFPGVEGEAHTLWKGGGGPDTLSDEMLAALDKTFDWIKAQFESHGATWKTVHAHRQSCDTRRADPGSEIWQKVGMVWLERISGSDGGPGWLLKKGRPIPHQWNPAYDDEY